MEFETTNEDMVATLQSFGLQVQMQDDMIDVRDIYETIIAQGNAIYNGADLMEQIIFPTHPTMYLNHTKKLVSFH